MKRRHRKKNILKRIFYGIGFIFIVILFIVCVQLIFKFSNKFEIVSDAHNSLALDLEETEEKVLEEFVAPTSSPIEATSTEENIPAKNVQPIFNVSDGNPEQSDTVVATISNLSSAKSVKTIWNDREINFTKIGEVWFGFLGVDAKKNPGEYSVLVSADDVQFTNIISIKKRPFPVTTLATTPELEAEGHTPTAIQSNVATENARLNSVFIYSPEARFSETFRYPLNKIVNVGAFGNIRKNGDISLQHLGVDLDAVEGTPVYAINGGVVAMAEHFDNYGNTVVIDHGLGIFSLYLHLSEFRVPVGKIVAKGETIALSGNTGYSIAPHLHFSVRIRNSSIDPLRFIETVNEVMAKVGK